MEILIRLLNPKITGWVKYYRHYCSKRTFGYISHKLFPPLWRWSLRRHPRKGARWVAKKYFRTKGHQSWRFSTKIKGNGNSPAYLDLVEINHVPIRRHVKIQSDTTPYDPAHDNCFRVRQTRRKENRLFFMCQSHWSFWWEIAPHED